MVKPIGCYSLFFCQGGYAKLLSKTENLPLQFKSYLEIYFEEDMVSHNQLQRAADGAIV